MKTAMQELISQMHKPIWNLMTNKQKIEMFNFLLEKEKEQIINAWNDKRMKVFLSDDTDELIELEDNDGEDFYNKTYNKINI